jgi:exonuclease SbcD
MKFDFTHITDIHIGSYGQGNIEAGSLNSRFIDFVKTYNEAIDYTVENKCDFCLITGDIFKHKDPQPVEIDAFGKGLKKLREANIETVIVLGNHDLFLSERLKNSIAILKTLNLSGIHISDTPENIYLKTKDGGRVCIQTMPYQMKGLLKMNTNEEVAIHIKDTMDRLYKEKEKGVPCIFGGHFSIKDSVTGAEQQTINKFNEPIVGKDAFKGKKYVYGAMGHLHRYQVVMKEPLVVYGGSLNRTDFNEWKEDKGFIHGTFDNKFSYEFVKVNAKKFVDLEYNVIDSENPEEEILADLDKRKDELKDAIVRIAVNLSEKNRTGYSAPNIAEFLSEHCDGVHGGTSPHIAKLEDVERGEYSEDMDSMEALKRYCDSNPNITNKPRFLKFAEDIIKETNITTK